MRGDFLRRIGELHQMQTEWILATGDAIGAEYRKIEDTLPKVRLPETIAS